MATHFELVFIFSLLFLRLLLFSCLTSDEIISKFNLRHGLSLDDCSLKHLMWEPDHDGLLSQFLQLKIKYLVAKSFNRTLILPPILSRHFNLNSSTSAVQSSNTVSKSNTPKEPLILCEIFILPDTIKCMKKISSVENYYTAKGIVTLRWLASITYELTLTINLMKVVQD
jgi:hypothetical protein